MIRRFLTLLMITLIAMQSVIAMADIHHVNFMHQTNNNHQIQAEIEPIVFVDQQPTDSNLYQHLDCNHCCHGACHFFIGVNQGSISNLKTHSDTTAYQVVYYSLVLSPENPPPIS